MRFKDNKAIYLQIADLICDDILQRKLLEDERIPSVREYATALEVNANTGARAYDWLQGLNIIYMDETLPDVARQMANLDITMNELTNGIINYQQHV